VSEPGHVVAATDPAPRPQGRVSVLGGPEPAPRAPFTWLPWRARRRDPLGRDADSRARSGDPGLAAGPPVQREGGHGRGHSTLVLRRHLLTTTGTTTTSAATTPPTAT
jgi:hypothetical protein